jgi:pimeloyl-ACP methyl ester carboxylesterase
MKRSLNIAGISLILVVLCASASQATSEIDVPTPVPQFSVDYDSTPPPNRLAVNMPDHYGNSLVSPPTKDDSHFVADTGGWLDEYLFRGDVPNGLLTFTIEIDRYYSPLITPDSVTDGFLNPSVLEELLDKHLLPESATLTLQVWDVDHNVSDCPEVDYVYINGQQVQNTAGTGPATLTSGNDTWSTWSISFPIEMLKFPTAKGSSGQRPIATSNEIAVEINVLQCMYPPDDPVQERWAVEVDWGSVFIPSPIRPIIFAHGWTGDTDAFDNFENWLSQDGIPSAGQVDLSRGIQPIAQTSPALATAIINATQEYGVDKLNLFAHSKGGLVSRHALRSSDVAERIERLITFGSPHHGTIWAEFPAGVEIQCRRIFGSDEDAVQDCLESSQEFRRDRMRDEFNYRGCTKEHWWSGWTECQPRYVQQPNVDYRSFASRLDEAVRPIRSTTYPWNADDVPFPNDIDVDELFTILSHSGLKEDDGAYRCAISYIDSNIYGHFLNCPILAVCRRDGFPPNSIHGKIAAI